MFNNPINFNDPSGHKACTDDGYCGSMGDTTYQKRIYANAIKDVYKWNLKGKWKLEELKTIYQTGRDIEKYADAQTGGKGLDWMLHAFGNTTIEHGYHKDGHSDAFPFAGQNFGARIRLDQNWMSHSWGAEVLFAHELGHVWDINTGFAASYNMNRDLGGKGACLFCAPGKGVPKWELSYHPDKGDAYGNSGRNEYFAEAFAAAIYNRDDDGVVSNAVTWIDAKVSNPLNIYPWRRP